MAESKIIFDTVNVGGVEYQVIKTGRAQARQALAVAKWIARHGSKAAKGMGDVDGEINSLEFLARLIEAMDDDALVDLFQVLVGCPKDDAEVYFDIAILVDVAVENYERNDAIRKLVERFLPKSDSNASLVEPPTTSE